MTDAKLASVFVCAEPFANAR